jgi:two-component system sensor histidine kinase DesK
VSATTVTAMSESPVGPEGTQQATLRASGRLAPLFAAIWLFFLLDPVIAGFQEDNRLRGLTGVAATFLFGAVYMTMWFRMRRDRVAMARFTMPIVERLGTLVLLVALGVAMVLLLGEAGIASSVYIGVAAVICFPMRYAAQLVVVDVAVTLLLGVALDWGSQVGTAFGIVAASVAVFGVRSMLSRNVELVVAHEENARLAVDNERNRFARDLHDILGHSLTVITVKAELAKRLMDVDPVRARAEVDDLERLARDALADVRRAVDGYRELTLPGELARARTALEAAEIAATLPNSTDDVPTERRELFAWAIREGITNVIRHSEASHCTVVLRPDCVEVRDDGVGPLGGGSGNGLRGLSERAGAVGGTVVTRVLDPGFSLSVVLP